VATAKPKTWIDLYFLKCASTCSDTIAAGTPMRMVGRSKTLDLEIELERIDPRAGGRRRWISILELGTSIG
jgi:hypothetical protein